MCRSSRWRRTWSRRSSRSRISASTITTASTSSASSRRRCRTSGTGRVQGASTITQQLARQSFLTPDKTYSRKLQELILAGRIERTFSKDRILELYLNKVYFGDGLYGVEAAARGYFGKHAADLTLPEAALLAGLVKSPSSYAPTVSLQRATARRNLVLQEMLESRVHRSLRRATRHGPKPWSCATACTPTNRTGSTSRSRCAASWSTGSAGSASTRAGCASTPRST